MASSDFGSDVGELGRGGLQREPDHLQRVLQVERDAGLVAHEEEAVGLLCRLAEYLAERRGVEDRADDGFEQRSARDQIRRPLFDQVDDQLGCDHLPDGIVLEGLRRVVGKGVLVDDLLARVEENRSQEHEHAGEPGQREARDRPGPIGGASKPGAGTRFHPAALPSWGSRGRL